MLDGSLFGFLPLTEVWGLPLFLEGQQKETRRYHRRDHFSWASGQKNPGLKRAPFLPCLPPGGLGWSQDWLEGWGCLQQLPLASLGLAKDRGSFITSLL